VIFNTGQADIFTLAKLSSISSFDAYRKRKLPAISGVIDAALNVQMTMPPML
jgi:hypothetical protein